MGDLCGLIINLIFNLGFVQIHRSRVKLNRIITPPLGLTVWRNSTSFQPSDSFLKKERGSFTLWLLRCSKGVLSVLCGSQGVLKGF